MKKTILSLSVLGLVLSGCAKFDKETIDVLLTFPTNKDVLMWSQKQRDAGFRALDRLTYFTKHNNINASDTPRPLPIGEPLNLPQIKEYMQSQNSSGIVIIHNGKIRLEEYGIGFNDKGRWTSFSVAKSFTSTLVGAAIQDGFIKSLEDNIAIYMPDLKGSAYDGVSVRQLLTMSSGVEWNEDYEDKNSDVNKFNNHKPPPNMDATISYMRGLKRLHKPGKVWNYNTGETTLIGLLIVSVTGKNLSQYLEEKIWKPYGMESDATWLLNSTGREIAGCCIQASIRDYARFGQFVLDGGIASGKQIVPKDWFKDAILKQKDIGIKGKGYGFQWWTYDDGSVAARGIFGQGIFIDSKRNLVIASNASWSRASLGPEAKAREVFYSQVQKAIDSEIK